MTRHPSILLLLTLAALLALAAGCGDDETEDDGGTITTTGGGGKGADGGGTSSGGTAGSGGGIGANDPGGIPEPEFGIRETVAETCARCDAVTATDAAALEDIPAGAVVEITNSPCGGDTVTICSKHYYIAGNTYQAVTTETDLSNADLLDEIYKPPSTRSRPCTASTSVSPTEATRSGVTTRCLLAVSECLVSVDEAEAGGIHAHFQLLCRTSALLGASCRVRRSG